MQPKVIIDNEVYRKIMHWVNKSDHEVSGLGIVSLEPSGIMRVTHAMLLPQVNTGTSTDIEPEDAARILYKCKDLPGELRFWWHSHVMLPVFWSGTDMDTIKKLGQGGWFLSTVFNKKREMRSSFYSVAGTQTPWGVYPLFQDKLDTQVEPFIENNAAQWDLEYTQNVKTREYSSHFERHSWANQYEDIPTDTRPQGISKKAWKRMRKASTPQVVHKQIMPPESTTDVYGFTQEDRLFLSQEGWTDNDIDQLFEQDVTPHEMLLFASYDLLPGEILVMLAQNWTPKDILEMESKTNDDMPVMDYAQGGKYDA